MYKYDRLFRKTTHLLWMIFKTFSVVKVNCIYIKYAWHIKINVIDKAIREQNHLFNSEIFWQHAKNCPFKLPYISY